MSLRRFVQDMGSPRPNCGRRDSDNHDSSPNERNQVSARGTQRETIMKDLHAFVNHGSIMTVTGEQIFSPSNGISTRTVTGALPGVSDVTRSRADRGGANTSCVHVSFHPSCVPVSFLDRVPVAVAQNTSCVPVSFPSRWPSAIQRPVFRRGGAVSADKEPGLASRSYALDACQPFGSESSTRLRLVNHGRKHRMRAGSARQRHPGLGAAINHALIKIDAALGKHPDKAPDNGRRGP